MNPTFYRAGHHPPITSIGSLPTTPTGARASAAVSSGRERTGGVVVRSNSRIGVSPTLLLSRTSSRPVVRSPSCCHQQQRQRNSMMMSSTLKQQQQHPPPLFAFPLSSSSSHHDPHSDGDEQDYRNTPRMEDDDNDDGSSWSSSLSSSSTSAMGKKNPPELVPTNQRRFLGKLRSLLAAMITTTTTNHPSRVTTSLVAALTVAAVAFLTTPHMASAATTATSLLSSLSQTGFYQAFSLVFVSEIGDKTFFIAGLLAMKTSRLTSFVGSMAALAAMTIISVLIGQVFHAIPSGLVDGVPLDDIAAVLAFLFFGFKTLQEALAMDDTKLGGGTSAMDEELADAEDTVEKTDVTRGSQLATIFALVFAAELGDRSFLSTIALSAAQAPVAVACGAIAAHAVATGIAVAGGSVVAKYLSERVIGLIGGTLFIAFAITTALGIF